MTKTMTWSQSPPLPLASTLPRDGALRLELERTFQPAEATWGVFTYAFVIMADAEAVGTLSLRIGDSPAITLYAGHLGLGIDQAHRGQGYASRAARLMLPLARAHRLDPMWITCSPENAASIRAIESLGATFVETISLPPDHDGHAIDDRHKRRYRLDLGIA